MIQKIQSVKGMHDLLPTESFRWQYLESVLRETFSNYGYKEIRTPIVEEARLYTRSLGEVTDIVEKEMYAFSDKDGKTELSLRPELTAGIVRSGIQHGLFHNQIQKVWQIGSVFRYDRPQKGRYRQFNQADVEVFGIDTPDIDAEVIAMTYRLWKNLNIHHLVKLEVNSMGTEECRKNYREALVSYLESHRERLDEDSLRRLTQNPLRILDSKNPEMQELLANAPKLIDSLTIEARAHFDTFCRYLDEMNIPYEINHRIVRGMDYYTKTVFEWTTDLLGAQATICGGGRYDKMVESLGGKETPAIGFGIGVERLLLVQETLDAKPSMKTPSLVGIFLGDKARQHGLKLIEELRDINHELFIQTIFGSDSMKSNMKKADQSGALYAIIMGEDEIENKVVSMKDLRQNGEQKMMSFIELKDWVKNFK